MSIVCLFFGHQIALGPYAHSEKAVRRKQKMKNLLIAVAVACLGINANAAPYFRVIDPNKPYKIVGAYVDPGNPGNTSFGTAIALVTHSTRDGCLFPKIVCEDWSPLMVGPSYNAGRFQVNIGPAVNLAPIARNLIVILGDKTLSEQNASGLRSALTSVPLKRGAQASISFGPALNFAPIQHGIVLPLNQWQGRFRLFAGAALEF